LVFAQLIDISWLKRDEVSMHWAVGVALVVFLTCQITFFLWHGLTCGARSRRLRQLLAEGDFTKCQDHLDPRAAKPEWVRWIGDRLREGTFTDGHYSRDDALRELDIWIESGSPYLLLQRMAIMAPLVGLLITVIGFLFLKPPSAETNDLAEILHSLSPLVMGVGTGALLALINQVLLFLAGKRADGLRVAGRDWFDSCVWRFVERHSTADHVAGALAAVTKTISGSFQQYEATATSIHESSQAMQKTVQAMHQTTKHFQESTGDLRGQFEAVGRLVEGLAERSEMFLPRVEQAAASLSAAVGGFQQALQEPGKIGNGGSHTANDLLVASCSLLQETLRVHRESTDGLRLSIENSLIPASEAVHQAATSLAESSTTLAGQVGQFGGAMGSAVEILDSLVPAAGEAVSGLGATMSSFHDAVHEQFLPSADMHRKIACTIGEAVGQLDAGIMAIRDGSATLKETLVEQRHGAAAIGHAASSLADSSTQLVGRVDQIGSAMQSAVQSLGSLVASAGQQMAGLEPAVAAFSDAVQEQVAPSARACSQGMSDMAATAAQFKQVTSAIQSVAGVLEGVIAAHSTLAARLDPSCRALADTVAQYHALGDSLGQSFQDGLIPAEQSLCVAARSVQGSADQLAQFIREGVQPATVRLVQLEEMLGRVQQAADRLQSAGAVEKEFGRLAASLARAVETADALAALRERIQPMVDQFERQRESDGRAADAWYRRLLRR
jgi:ABC-type transporter Mla subunit MlaD